MVNFSYRPMFNLSNSETDNNTGNTVRIARFSDILGNVNIKRPMSITISSEEKLNAIISLYEDRKNSLKDASTSLDERVTKLEQTRNSLNDSINKLTCDLTADFLCAVNDAITSIRSTIANESKSIYEESFSKIKDYSKLNSEIYKTCNRLGKKAERARCFTIFPFIGDYYKAQHEDLNKKIEKCDQMYNELTIYNERLCLCRHRSNDLYNSYSSASN